MVLRYIGIALAVLILLAAMALAWLHTDSGREFVLERLKAGAREEGVELSVGYLDYNLFRLTAELRDVSAWPVDRLDFPPFVTAEVILAELSPRTFLPDTVKVSHAIVEGVHVDYRRDAAGRSNFIAPVPMPELVVSTLAVTGSLTADDLQEGVAVRLPQWRMRMEGDRLTGVHTVRLVLEEPGQLQWEGESFPLHNLQAVARMPAEMTEAEIERFRIVSEESHFTMSGRITDLLSQPVLDLRADGQLDLEPIIPLAGVLGVVEGIVDFTARVRGSAEAPEVRIEIEGEEPAISWLRALRFLADLILDVEDERITIEFS
jgi:hypothetical protein